jgi:hypothetical protein
MKRILSLLSAVTMIIALTTLLSITSCQKEARNQTATSAEYNELAARATSPAPLKVLSQPVYMHIEDENGSMPVSDDAKLFNKQTGEHIPVMTPDGHHVTLKEFKMASGWADVKCINAGTHAVIHLKGLIPNGTYSVWLPIFNESHSRIAFGAFGSISGSKNYNGFEADAEGNATVSLIRPAGTMETDGTDPAQGSVSNCLGDYYESHLAIAYHLDGKPQQPGPRSTWVVQVFFQIWGSQL